MWKKKKCRKLARQAKRCGKHRRNQNSKSSRVEIEMGYEAIVRLCNRAK